MDVRLPDVSSSANNSFGQQGASSPSELQRVRTHRRWSVQTSYTALSISVGLAAIAACWLSLLLSDQKFTGYDVSPLIDAGWRVLNGQVPGRDFVITFPASLYLTVAAAYKLFGVTWHAIALMACLQYVLVLVAGLRLGMFLRRSSGEARACWLVTTFAIGQTLLLVSINLPWHASMAQSFGLYAVLSTLVLIEWRTLSTAHRAESMAHLALAFAVLLISKPNTSFVIVAVCLVALLRADIGKRWIAFVLAGSLVFVSLVLRFVRVTLLDTVLSYRGLTGRMVPHGFLHGLFIHPAFSYGLGNLAAYALFLPVFGAVVLAFFRDKGWRSEPAGLLAVGAMLAALAGMGTNFDFKLTDTPLLLMGLAIVLAPGARLREAILVRQFAIAECGLLALALYFGVSRYRMMWASQDCQVVPMDDRFLGSMEVCPVVKQTIGEIDGAMQQEPGQNNVFMGPSLEFMYAARQIPSPRYLPAWWDLGTSYPLSMQPRLVQAWSAHRFRVVFIAPAMLGYLPLPVQRELLSGYDLLSSDPLLQVYRRKE